MFDYSLLVLLSFISTLASASPISVVKRDNAYQTGGPGTPSTDSSSEAACIIIVLTLFCILSLLVLLKHMFMKRRRIQTIHGNAGPDHYSKEIESFHHSSTSVLPSLRSSITVKNVKRAFFVGLLGSPTWEAKSSTAFSTDDLTWKERQQSAFMYQLHTESRRRKSLHSQHSRSNDSSSVTEFGGSGHSSRRTRSSALSDPTRATQLPTYPAKARRSSSLKETTRRYSLQGSRRREYQGSGQVRRHSSLKSTRSRRSNSSSVYNYPGLRIVESDNARDSLLPLSPKEHSATSPRISSTTLTSRTNARFSDMSTHPLPALPPSVASSPFFDGSEPSDGRSYISHPYALLPVQKSNKTPRSHTVPLANGRSLEAAVDHLRVNNTASNANSSEYSPLEVKAVSPISPTFVSSFQSKPAAALPKTKPTTKPRQPSLRARKSPSIGPSPLRIMTLPETLAAEMRNSPQKNPQRRPEKENDMSMESASTDRSSQRSSYLHLGIGYPNSRTAHRDSQDRSGSRRLSHASFRRMSHAEVDDNDPSILLGIIRELVEETSQWDADLYMDDNFKSMIQDSGAGPSGEEGSFAEDRSVEMDLGLLGLDVFRTEDFSNGYEEEARNGEMDGAASYEQGGYTYVHHIKPENVGVAW